VGLQDANSFVSFILADVLSEFVEKKCHKNILCCCKPKNFMVL